MPDELAFMMIDQENLSLSGFPVAQIRLHVGIPVDLDVSTQAFIREDRAVAEVVTDAKRIFNGLVRKWFGSFTTNVARVGRKGRAAKVSALQRQNLRALEGEIAKARASSGPSDRRGGIDHRLESAVLLAARKQAGRVRAFEQSQMKTRVSYVSNTLMLAIHGLALVFLGRVESGLSAVNLLLQAATALYQSSKEEAQLRRELTAIFDRIRKQKDQPSTGGLFSGLTTVLSTAIWGTDASQAEARSPSTLETQTRELARRLEELLNAQELLQLKNPSAPEGSAALQEIVEAVARNGEAITAGKSFAAYAARQIKAAKARGKFTGQDQVVALAEIALSWKAFTLVCYTMGVASVDDDPWAFLQKKITDGLQGALEEAIEEGVSDAFEEQLKKVKITVPRTGGKLSIDLSDIKKLVDLAVDPPSDALAKGKAAAELLGLVMDKAEDAELVERADSELFTEAFGQIKELVENVAEVLEEDDEE